MAKKTIVAIFISCIILSNSISLSYNEYVWSITSETSSNIDEEQTVASIIKGENVEENNLLNLECGSAILIEQTTGQILYSHNVHEQLRPASVTKVMSILLIMEQISTGRLTYDTKIPCSPNAASMGGSQIWLDTKEKLTVDEMLRAISISSANDCVMAMAEYIAGTEEKFVELMNEKAKQLGMNDTTFKNCHGLDEDGHVTSSYDISLMSRELLVNYPEITKYTSTYMDSLRDGKSELVNTNKLVRNYEGCTGLKTGSTGLALYNVSASATREGLSLIAVIMKGPTAQKRFDEAEKLLDYGFNTFEYKQFALKEDKLKDVDISKGIYPTAEAVFENNVGILIQKGQANQITQSVTIGENISAPIVEGQKLGEVTYSVGDDKLLSVNIVAKQNVKKMNMFTMLIKLYEKWGNLLR
ncbi:MAG: D-alanyl-D-alanine carboxypeptidase [Clostridia bacterium]|nr:D-alanyl-D-alanine carboxypeptidase [Clostridia bacterium]